MSIFDIFKDKKKVFKETKISNNKKKVSRKETSLEDLANDIHNKFHLTCDVLEKIKPNTSCDALIEQLNNAGVSEDKFARNTFELDLDIGNAHISSKIQNDDHSVSNFQRFNFAITGIGDYSGLHLSFDNENKKREINLFDHSELWGKMKNPELQAKLDSMKITSIGKQLYELILAKGKFKK
jgi:hypothetical protein